MIKRSFPSGNSLVTITLCELLEGGFCLFDPEDKYPIWDENHRAELEKKIIEHYMYRQIGFETPARFKFELNKLMREIMPNYIKIWKTTQYKYNPIENYNMREGSTDIAEHASDDQHQSTSRFSDTPQGSIDNIDKYITTANKDDGSVSSKSNGKTDHTAWRNGNIGVTTTQQMIEQERKITIDVDMMIINELKSLFLGVY